MDSSENSCVCDEKSNNIKVTTKENAQLDYSFFQPSSKVEPVLDVISHPTPHLKQLALNITHYEESFQSNRVKLKLLALDDEAFYVDVFTDENITTYTGGSVNTDNAKSYFLRACKAITQTPVKYITWVVEELTTGSKIGIATLTLLNQAPSCGEIGLMCKKSFHGQGIGCQVLASLIAIGFDNYQLKSLISFTESQNTCAQHVLQKYNFRQYESNKLKPPTQSGMYWRLLPNVHLRENLNL